MCTYSILVGVAALGQRRQETSRNRAGRRTLSRTNWRLLTCTGTLGCPIRGVAVTATRPCIDQHKLLSCYYCSISISIYSYVADVQDTEGLMLCCKITETPQRSNLSRSRGQWPHRSIWSGARNAPPGKCPGASSLQPTRWRGTLSIEARP